MKIEIWSDVLCPWCYIGKREFENALNSFEHKDEVEVTWKSYELDPASPKDHDMDMYDLIASKYRTTRERSKEMHRNLEERAESVGLTYHFDIAKATNSFDAHRLIHLAAKHGKQGEMIERISAAYLTEGKHIGDHDTLKQLAVDAGLDGGEVSSMLSGNDLADEVRKDEQEAGELGITGVPYFVIERKYGISGAQPAGVFAEALQNVWKEQHP